MRDVVTRLTDLQELARLHPWKVGDAPTDHVDGMLKGIFVVELNLTRIDGKWKASRNRSDADR